MKSKLLIIILVIPFTGLSQGVNNLWLMGYDSWAGLPYGGINMDFTGGSLNINYQNRKMSFGTTNAVICNKNGEFLFSSNGTWIANNTNDTMLNGSGLNPSFYSSSYPDGLYLTQGNLIIPFPLDSNKYYLFHSTVDVIANPSTSLYLYNSIIDMTGDSDRGIVTDKNNILLNDSLFPGLLTACKHANGRDLWLITHQFRSGDSISFINSSTLFYKFLITPYGILGPDSQSAGVKGYQGGQCVFSPDGRYFATYDAVNLYIFDFDRCTGNLSSKATIFVNDSAFGFGVAFSPNSQVLYTASGYTVDQFNMNASDIGASKTTVLIWDNTYSPHYPLAAIFFLAQLAPDGKIYINCGNSDVMHVINNPDVVGFGCNACQHCVPLPALNAFTIPNHPNYFLGAETGSVCDTLTSLAPALSKGDVALKIYPNPVVSEEITFTYNVTSEQGAINIYNIEGKEVARYNIPQWSSVQHVSLPKLAPGIYAARRQGNEIQSLSVKFIIQ